MSVTQAKLPRAQRKAERDAAKRTTRVIVRAARRLLVVRQQALSAERDKLREVRHEIEALEESCENAIHDLDSAIDSLSQYV